MIVKFIVSHGTVFFGTRRHEFHADIAREFDVEVTDGGGKADLSSHRIFGTSYGFGNYDPQNVQQLLPEWVVEQPSAY
jgi:hypothetical protein